MIDGFVNIYHDENDHGFGFCLNDVAAVLLQHGFSYDSQTIDTVCLIRDTVKVYIGFHGKEQYVDAMGCYVGNEAIATTTKCYHISSISYLFYEVDPLLFTKAVYEPPDKIISAFQEQQADKILDNLD